GPWIPCGQGMSGTPPRGPQSPFPIVGHKAAFASRVRSHWAWAIPLPEGINAAEAGPLLCGGMTVFNPLAMYARPTSRVGIVGIGGRGPTAVEVAAAHRGGVAAGNPRARTVPAARETRAG